MSKSLIQFIPEHYRLPAVIFFAAFPWLVVAIVAFKAWRITVKKRHGALAYRALEERCRCIVDAAGDAFPEVRELRGTEFTDAVKGKLMQAAVIISSIQSKKFPEGMPANLRWCVTQIQSIQHHLREHEYEGGDVSPAGTVLIALQTPAPSLERAVRRQAETNAALSANNASLTKEVERLRADFKRTIAVCADYAPSMTFVDNLFIYVGACLEDVRSYVGKPKL